MLDTVVQEIHQSPCIPYKYFFGNYVMSVQDDQIEQEISFFISNNNLDVRSLDRVADMYFREACLK